jgi:hypothetical protein
MKKLKETLIQFVLATAMLAAPVSVFPNNEAVYKLTTPEGDVAFEVVGQVTNFPPATPGQPASSQQYGYLGLINGPSADQIFSTPRLLLRMKPLHASHSLPKQLRNG